MVGPQPGGVDLSLGARLYTCVGDWRPGEDLRRALADLGHTVSDATTFDEVVELIPAGEAAAVIAHADELGDDLVHRVADLKRLRPDARVLLLGELDTPEQLMAAITAGVAGFCPPDADVDAVVRTLSDMLEAGVAIPRSMVAPIVEQLRHGPGRRVTTAAGPIDVTEREWEILQLLMQQRSTREMADVLYVSVGTVRSHVSTLLKKLGAIDREDAIRLVERGRSGDEA